MCPALVRGGGGYCPIHKRDRGKAYDQQRGTSTQRGYGVTHRRLRKIVMAEQPLCPECLKDGKVEPGTEMDHIDGNPMNRARKNLQMLCKRHHSLKTVREQGGFTGKARGR